MNLLKPWLAAASLMLLAFGLYIVAPSVRARLAPQSPTPTTTASPSVGAIQSPPTPAKAVEAPTEPRLKAKHKASLPSAAHPLANINAASLDDAPGAANPGGIGVLDTSENTGSDPVTRVISLLPGQSVNLKNREFERIEIHSQFPIQALIAGCRRSNVVQAFCVTEPGDVFISDLRSQPIFRAPEANSITVTMSH